MLDFRLDQEQTMLVEAIHKLSAQKVRLQFREAEESGTISADLLQMGWELGLLPSSLPEQYGGFGALSAVTGAVALEELAWGDVAISLNITQPHLVALPLLRAGTEAQKERWLPLFCGENAPRLTAALTEPSFRYNPLQLQTVAIRDGDDYVLKGTKSYVPLAHSAETILVWANEAGKTQGFLVSADCVGLQIGPRNKLMGINALPLYQVQLNEVRVSADDKLGGVTGCDYLPLLNRSRVAMGAVAVGMMRAAYEYARDYAKTRVQFGRAIAQNQSIAFMLADMATDVDSARLMVWEAAWKADQGETITREAAVLKQYIDEVAVSVADRAVQILGGYGYIREYPVELWLRNARGFATFDGLAMI